MWGVRLLLASPVRQGSFLWVPHLALHRRLNRPGAWFCSSPRCWALRHLEAEDPWSLQRRPQLRLS